MLLLLLLNSFSTSQGCADRKKAPVEQQGCCMSPPRVACSCVGVFMQRCSGSGYFWANAIWTTFLFLQCVRRHAFHREGQQESREAKAGAFYFSISRRAPV